jgi:hypothetical protein
MQVYKATEYHGPTSYISQLSSTSNLICLLISKHLKLYSIILCMETAEYPVSTSHVSSEIDSCTIWFLLLKSVKGHFQFFHISNNGLSLTIQSHFRIIHQSLFYIMYSSDATCQSKECSLSQTCIICWDVLIQLISSWRQTMT